ncbi:flagellin [Acetoanaerobium pronyense]|uniref:Flagellin n=1 Tax=Acetoanaerobium pronyense TaxID=1482736 RepID=A0ABS4KJ49_9FIRM|nr:flagellin [Acetoanaerobium pronyense]MBP2027785.1 flagellin [Acetoanaerobium pronyense]
MIINNNMMAMNSHRAMGINSGGMGRSIEKLSSGQRINRAGDDAAGLSISEKMRGQIRGLNMASKNAQDGISLIQTAEGALDEVHAMLQRMRELSVQAANDTNVGIDRTSIKDELTQLSAEIDEISKRTEFNTQKLISGSFTNKTFHIGANISQAITVSIGNMSAASLGVNALAVSTATLAGTAISTVNQAITDVSAQRSKLGAIQNRLEHTIKNLGNSAENLQAAESRLRDTDMAKEMSSFTKSNILAQASQAMLAQANQLPQQVLQLLR